MSVSEKLNIGLCTHVMPRSIFDQLFNIDQLFNSVGLCRQSQDGYRADIDSDGSRIWVSEKPTHALEWPSGKRIKLSDTYPVKGNVIRLDFGLLYDSLEELQESAVWPAE